MTSARNVYGRKETYTMRYTERDQQKETNRQRPTEGELKM